MWFEELTGFPEQSPQQVRDNMTLDGQVLTSRINDQSYWCGQLETPTLAQLRERVLAIGPPRGKMVIREVVADVQSLHADVANAGALFQVASQFNLLEMVSPSVTPEQGVGMYECDPTQGPACAVAAGAGTIYRNYFADVHGRIGQSTDQQIDCLADMGHALGNADGRLWAMRNGYVLATQSGLTEIGRRLQASSEHAIDELRQLLRIGIQSNTQVTLHNATHTVSQAYCSALPVAYSPHPAWLWEPFARLVLEAAYEATLCAAVLNGASCGNNTVYLTLLGGGAFGNDIDWIMAGINRALHRFKRADLDVVFVSHGASNARIQQLIHQGLSEAADT